MQKPQQQLEREQQLLQQQLEQGEQRHQQQLEREQQQQQQQPQKQQHSEQSGHRHQQQQQEQQLEQQQQEASAGSVMYEFLSELPKAELHIHLEGTLEIPMMFDLAGVGECGGVVAWTFESVEARMLLGGWGMLRYACCPSASNAKLGRLAAISTL